MNYRRGKEVSSANTMCLNAFVGSALPVRRRWPGHLFDVLLEKFDQKLAFVVYFREERQVRLGRNLRERACLVTVSSDDFLY